VPIVGEAGVFVNLTVNTDVFIEASKDIFFDQDVLPIISDILFSVHRYAISLSNSTYIEVTLGFEICIEETSYLLCFNLIRLIFEIEILRNPSRCHRDMLRAVHYFFSFDCFVYFLLLDFLHHLKCCHGFFDLFLLLEDHGILSKRVNHFTIVSRNIFGR